MASPEIPDESRLRVGTPADTDSCVALWVASCAERDGRAIAGVAERARPKFDRASALIIADGDDGRPAGFALVTEPGSGEAADPPEAVLLSLLAVDPAAQGVGLGGRLLRAAMEQSRADGFAEAVLHVLTENTAAIRLYEAAGWVKLGAPVEHSLLRRPTQTYVCRLA